jgi:hypothetical protein
MYLKTEKKKYLYKILFYVIIISLRDILKKRGRTAMIECVYKNVIQKAGWALPRPFLYIREIFQNKEKI